MSPEGLIPKAAGFTKHQLRVARQRLPRPIRTVLIRRQHLRNVLANIGPLIDPAFLGRPGPDVVSWTQEGAMPPLPFGTWDLLDFDSDARLAAEEWLKAGPYDSDDLLELRTDNVDDEIGRVEAALRLRVAIAAVPEHTIQTAGDRVLFDARSLQTQHFSLRGIGRFARAALLGARAAVGDDRLVLFTDKGLDDLSPELAGECEQITQVTDRTAPRFSVLVEPSPMNVSAEPLLALLHGAARCIAVVYDFIPYDFPTIYLGSVGDRLEYAAALDGLRKYDDFVCISESTRSELRDFLAVAEDAAQDKGFTVAWPDEVLPGDLNVSPSGGSGPIVIVTGNDPRKNTFGALAAAGAATAGDDFREVVVVGVPGLGSHVHHWSLSAAMRVGEASTAGYLSDDELHGLLSSASVVVVDSFAEGLSLPVIEAIRSGATVVASDIPAHRELLGAGSFLIDPADPASGARGIRKHLRQSATHTLQLRRLLAHQHASLDRTIAELVTEHATVHEVAVPPAAVYAGGRDLRVGIATPWPPQRTGIADFSVATTIELAKLCDVTVFTTSDADVAATVPSDVRLLGAPIGEARERAESGLDVLVSVVGNSHYHVPFLKLMSDVGCVAVAHDTRMVEFYRALRGNGGVQQVMLRGTDLDALSPSLDDQFDDMRLLQNAGFWEVARRSRALIMHSPTSAPRIAEQTGVTPYVLPFANYRAPLRPVTQADRAAARSRLGLDQLPVDTVHLATFGYVDLRSKLVDVVLESAGWLTQWGRSVNLTLAGSCDEATAASLGDRARELGLAHFVVTGFLTDQQYRDYLIAIDVGVQLRISPFMGVCGPLADLASHGTPAVASRGIATDVGAPEFMDRLPDDISPIILAEAVLHRLANPTPSAQIEEQRREYLDRQSPRRYAEEFLAVLTAVASTSPRGGG